MNKVFVTIIVPILQQEYEMFIPVSKRIDIVIDLLKKAINELSNGSFPIEKDMELLRKNGEGLYNYSTVKENQVKNGDILVLI